MKSVSTATMNLDDLATIEIPVTNGANEYVLKELSARDAKAYKNAQIASMVTSKTTGMIIGARDPGNLEPLLVHLSLWKVIPGKDIQTQVPQKEIETWDYRKIKRLFDKAKEISNLEEEDSKLRSLFIKAFKRDDAPTDLEKIRDWVKTLDTTEYKHLQLFCKFTPEELAKNSQDDTTDGSE